MSELRIGVGPIADYLSPNIIKNGYQVLPEGYSAVIIGSSAVDLGEDRAVSYTAQLGEVTLFSAADYGGLNKAYDEILSVRQKQSEHGGARMDIYPFEMRSSNGWVGITNDA